MFDFSVVSRDMVTLTASGIQQHQRKIKKTKITTYTHTTRMYVFSLNLLSLMYFAHWSSFFGWQVFIINHILRGFSPPLLCGSHSFLNLNLLSFKSETNNWKFFAFLVVVWVCGCIFFLSPNVIVIRHAMMRYKNSWLPIFCWDFQFGIDRASILSLHIRKFYSRLMNPLRLFVTLFD